MANKLKEYTIYALMRPDTFAVFYVGITVKHLSQRTEHHISDAKFPRKWSTASRPTIAALIELGLEPIGIVLDKIATSDKRFAQDLERFWINHTWSTGHPIENKRGLHYDDRPIYLGLIKRLHQAIEAGSTYDSYQFSERVPRSSFIANWGFVDSFDEE